jgi:hypothetical protein
VLSQKNKYNKAIQIVLILLQFDVNTACQEPPIACGTTNRARPDITPVGFDDSVTMTPVGRVLLKKHPYLSYDDPYDDPENTWTVQPV